jgi:hypothetical protein
MQTDPDHVPDIRFKDGIPFSIRSVKKEKDTKDSGYPLMKRRRGFVLVINVGTILTSVFTVNAA